MTRRPVQTLVVLGMMGRLPFAGVAWQVLHYLVGFHRLGWDVYYVEDTGEWPYDPEKNSITEDCGYPTRYIARQLEWCGLRERWAYVSAAHNGRSFGLSDDQLASIYQRADVLINLTGATLLREQHLRVPVRIYLETDPVLPQVEVAQGRKFTIELLDAHTHHFTYGENLGAPDCGVPVVRYTYRPTRQPVVLDWWRPAQGSPDAAENGRFTTVASWQQTGIKDLKLNGETYYWSKHLEFLKFIDLPCRTPESFELALACGDDDAIRLLAGNGWKVRDALSLSNDCLTYRSFITGSRGEFTVAKDQNIRLRSGWFSDRSACYLAAGRPVITQDTAFGKVLPTGEGLFAFRTMDDVLAALDAIRSDYPRHSRAARAIAEEYFRAETVLQSLLTAAGLS